MDTKTLAKLLRKLDEQSFRPGDSVVASTINHPIDAIGKFGGWLANQVNTAAGIPDQYDNPYPYLAPSPEAQTQAAFDVAGMAQLGSMPFAPKSAGGTVGTFIGPKAATWDADKAAAAAKMLDDGVDPAQVWKQHMIGRMPDGNLFSEIDDSAASIGNNSLFHGGLDSSYPGMPSLVNFGIEAAPGINGMRTKGRIDVTQNADNPLSTALHELQHEIQAREGFALGGNVGDFPNSDSLKKGKIIAALQRKGLDDSQIKRFLASPSVPSFYSYPDTSKKISNEINSSADMKKYYQYLSGDPFKNYKRLTGEAQARATQDRLNMNMDERRANYPLAGGKLADIPLDQLIYRYGDNGPAMAIDAWHASPHKFDEFDMSKIGAGEGAQAYGHGLYFAESPKVSGIDGEYFNKFKSQHGDAYAYKTSLEWPDPAREAVDPLGPHHFLDWDKPLSEQSESVRSIFNGMGIDSNINGFDAYKTIEQKARESKPEKAIKQFENRDDALAFYNQSLADWKDSKIGDAFKPIAKQVDGKFSVVYPEQSKFNVSGLGPVEDASAYLNKLGIPGIRYLDGGSRGAGEGSYNYVVFDDQIPRIVERNGQPVNALAEALRNPDNLNESLLQKYLQQGSLTPDELAQYERNAVTMRDSNRQYLNVANADAQGGTAIDRARDMGFDVDTPLYHGALNGNQDSFVSSAGGELGPGLYVTDNPDLANEFARTQYGGQYPEKSGVYSVMTKKLEKIPRNDWVDARGKEMDRLRADNGGEWEGRFYNQSMANMRNLTEESGNYGWYTPGIGGENQGVVFDPKNIRSRFAAFDPLRKDSADLLATKLLPASMLGLGMYGMEQDRRNPLAEALRGQ